MNKPFFVFIIFSCCSRMAFGCCCFSSQDKGKEKGTEREADYCVPTRGNWVSGQEKQETKRCDEFLKRAKMGHRRELSATLEGLLRRAVLDKNIKGVTNLLALKADPNGFDSHGKRPIDCVPPDSDMAQILLRRKVPALELDEIEVEGEGIGAASPERSKNHVEGWSFVRGEPK